MKLNFPSYTFKTKQKQGKQLIFDAVRRKFVALTPEEWVRQHVIRFLAEEKQISPQLMSVERQITVNKLSKRFDLLVFNNQAKPVLLVECKSPAIKITRQTLAQIAFYNSNFNVQYLFVTNGLKHVYFKFHNEKLKYEFVADLPMLF